jgi:predicted Zn-dependent peptidase
MVLCAAGPLPRREVETWTRRAFAHVPRGERPRPKKPRAAGPGPRFRAVHNESAQTQVQILFHALPESDPDFQALRALVRVLDDGMSTRLHYQICDQKGLAYSVSGTLSSYHDSALLEIDAACAHAKLPDLVEEALAILARFRTELVSEQELDKAKRRFLADLEACYDDLDGLCGWFGGTELFYRPRSQEERAKEIDRVRPEHLRRVARRVIRPERLNVAAVGSLRPPLSRRVAKIVKEFR